MNTTNINDFDDFDDYCAALSRKSSLTPVEYRYLVSQSIAYGEEHHAESATQYRSECALFGDAGPGQARDLRNAAQCLADDRATHARLGRIIANLAA
jgi:hypothetical protein